MAPSALPGADELQKNAEAPRELEPCAALQTHSHSSQVGMANTPIILGLLSQLLAMINVPARPGCPPSRGQLLDIIKGDPGVTQLSFLRTDIVTCSAV